MIRFVAVLILSACPLLSWATAQSRSIILQSTTSTANSGLYDHLLPIFEDDTGIKVHVVAVGTGQALRNGRNGDGDVLLVHAKIAEEKFVADGYGVRRDNVMYNDFVIVGPPNDPADILTIRNAATALAKIASSRSIFVSRGDNSGTHAKERALWQAAGVDPVLHSGKWYRETGSGMGATLNIAMGMDAYALTDRATWLTFGNKRDFRILIEGDPALFNQYGIIMINPDRHRRVKQSESQRFIYWMLGQKGQKAIATFKLSGEQLFFPNANRQ
ncbi:MAG: Tungstate-binding protein TupA [Alphaproteobacteria bacterium MarineAlpha4_Bin2]|nr:MAG: Tungstate-binding protein TupA [Alphaproteobacteria bacterium MarineAlpha4_Bin2]